MKKGTPRILGLGKKKKVVLIFRVQYYPLRDLGKTRILRHLLPD